MTPKQKKLLEFIHRFGEEHGYAPTQREIASHFGWKSLGTVQDYIKILVRQGVLNNRWNGRRSLEIKKRFLKLSPPGNPKAIFLVGTIAAGRPIEAVEDVDPPVLWMPGEMVSEGEFFALRVEGESMVEEGIRQGDYIIVKKQENFENGNMVVALLGHEATVKKIYRHRGGKIELRPANSRMDSLWTKAGELRIQGLVVGLYRRYPNG